MKRFFLLGLIVVSLLAVTVSPSWSQVTLPEGAVEQAGVGAPGPRLTVGERTYTTEEFVALVAQDASVAWGAFFASIERPFIPPTVITLAAGAYARSGCGVNAGDPAEDANLTPALYCRYGGEVGAQSISATEIIDTAYTFSPVIYLSVPWLEAYAAESGAAPDVALAYRVVREYTHHVQDALDITDHTGAGCCDVSDDQVALVAECFTGVWAFTAYDQGQLDLADIERSQAAAWGADATPVAVFGRETVTGSAEEQREAFVTGYERGRPDSCLE